MRFVVSTSEFGLNPRSPGHLGNDCPFCELLHLDDDVSKALFIAFGDAVVMVNLQNFRCASTETNRLLVKRSQHRAVAGTILLCNSYAPIYNTWLKSTSSDWLSASRNFGTDLVGFRSRATL